MNKIFNWLWYFIFKKLIPAGKGTGYERNHNRLKFQISMAKLFGGVKGIILGDSEGETFDSYSVMKSFNVLVICGACGGTTPKNLTDYFTGTGKDLYKYLIANKVKVILSDGGNCSLLSRMGEIPDSMTALHNMFPVSWMMLIPPAHVGIMGKLPFGKDAAQWKTELETIRSFQRTIWSPLIIDTYSPFLDPQTGEATILYLKDPVHFSRVAVDLIQKIINVII
jgi:hypothetical protein